jgi:hypothetical protein
MPPHPDYCWRWSSSNFYPNWPQVMTLLISSSQLAEPLHLASIYSYLIYRYHNPMLYITIIIVVAIIISIIMFSWWGNWGSATPSHQGGSLKVPGESRWAEGTSILLRDPSYLVVHSPCFRWPWYTHVHWFLMTDQWDGSFSHFIHENIKAWDWFSRWPKATSYNVLSTVSNFASFQRYLLHFPTLVLAFIPVPSSSFWSAFGSITASDYTRSYNTLSFPFCLKGLHFLLDPRVLVAVKANGRAHGWVTVVL